MESKVQQPATDYDKCLAENCMCKEGTMSSAAILSSPPATEAAPAGKATAATSAKKREPDPVIISSSDEALFAFDLTTQLFYRLIQGDTTREFIEYAKKILGEARTQEVIRQVESTPAEQKKAIMDYAKSFK